MKVEVDEKVKKLFKGYILKEVDEFFYEILIYDIEHKGVENVFNDCLEYIRCDVWDNNNKFRIMQTIGVPYQIYITKLVMILDLYPDEITNGLDKIIERHNFNLNYEKEHPCVIYDKKTIKLSKKKVKEKVKKEKVPKLSKEAKQALKFANVTFKIKI